MNAQNNVDLFSVDRMATISEGVTSLLEGREPSSPPSSIVSFLIYAVLFAVIVLQLRGMTRSVVALRRGGRVGPWWRIALSLAVKPCLGTPQLCSCPSSSGCRSACLPKDFRTPYILIISGVVALVWGLVQVDLGVLDAPQSEGGASALPRSLRPEQEQLEKGAVVQTVVIQEEPQDGARPAAVVTATGITRRYGEGDTAVDALRGVSLEIARGS